jgi:hypothetical protein
MADIPEGGFTKRKQLENWLNSLPESDIQTFVKAPFYCAVSRPFAMRCQSSTPNTVAQP